MDAECPVRVMVTGANGFVGHHVVRTLAAGGHQVVAVSRQPVADAALTGLVEAYLTCDLTDLDQAHGLPFTEVDAVINLAGLAAVGESFASPEEYLRVNAGVLDSIATVALERELRGLRVVAVSSGAVYAAGQPMPLSERAALDPTSSPYAASKLAMEDRATWYRGQGLDLVVVRPFNHIGPGQGPGFLVPDLVASIRRAHSSGDPIVVGDLSTRRDYTDVRDVAAAYVLLATTAGSLRHGLFNVCSGVSVPGSTILGMILARLELEAMPVTTDPRRLRPGDQPDIVGDSGLLRRELPWCPVVPFERSLHDAVETAWFGGAAQAAPPDRRRPGDPGSAPGSLRPSALG